MPLPFHSRRPAQVAAATGTALLLLIIAGGGCHRSQRAPLAAKSIAGSTLNLVEQSEQRQPAAGPAPMPQTDLSMRYAGAVAGAGVPGGCAVPGFPAPPPPGAPAWNTESYGRVDENPFQAVAQEPLSTFGIDVDTASYSNVRRFLQGGSLPPKDAVRVEELLNYFHYEYPAPRGEEPFSVNTEVLACPWQPRHRLVRIGLQGRRVDLAALPPRNLVFLIDVSGSMGEENKLPLVQRGLQRLCGTLRPQDYVAIVVYAGSTGVVLEPTSGRDQERIQGVIGALRSGGGTNGEGGIQLAYRIARKQFRPGADNRVLLCTDGDFNLGVTDQGSLLRLVEAQRSSGVFLTVLGFGMGNIKDATLVQLADRGNGHYAYIDTLPEMEKVFGEGGASLVTIAKDVKIQVEFNPAKVQAYRLIGYEKRLLAKTDFHDDSKDAGEINAGHAVTALFELVPPGVAMKLPQVDALKYQTVAKPDRAPSAELLTVKLRYKAPDSATSKLQTCPVPDRTLDLAQASPDARFATAVAAYGLLLRTSPHRGSATFDQAFTLAKEALGNDPRGERSEFLALVRKAGTLTKAVQN